MPVIRTETEIGAAPDVRFAGPLSERAHRIDPPHRRAGDLSGRGVFVG
jgi:hypothetical protein